VDRTTIDLWVGIFVALGVAALLGLAMKVGNLTSSQIGSTYSVQADFENVGSLKPHAPVKSAGVVVGRVDSITFDGKRFVAAVKIDIDKRYPFPKDTFANIYTAGLLGEQYIGLEAGGEIETLGNGDKIIQTQDAIVLEKMISRFLFSKAAEETSSSEDSNADTEAKPAVAKPTPLDEAGF
jgi:phospholipid/cholesterol/gamma-HCH transport system substrate-binding protein